MSRWEQNIDFSSDSDNYEAYEQPPPAAQAPKKAPQSVNRSVLVTKLKEGTTLGQINATFEKFGELDDITFGELQSEAIVLFTDPEGAAAALSEAVIHCAGKTVFIRPYNSNVVPASKPPAPSKPSSYHQAPQYHSSDHYQSAPPKHKQYQQQAPPPQYNPYQGGSMHGSQDYYQRPAPSKQHASPPPSSNRYPSGYPAEPSYSSHSHEENYSYHQKPQYHQSPPPKSYHYQQAPSHQYHQGPPYHSSEHYQSHHQSSPPQPKQKHYEQGPSPKQSSYQESSSHYPSGYGSYTQPPKEVNYSSMSYGGGGSSSNFTKNTGPKVDGVTSSGVEQQKFVDLCFMFDATGSMKAHIALAVQSIKDIVAKAQEKMKNRIIRLAFVVYRDYPDSPPAPVVEFLNFTQNVDLFMTSLSKIRTGGGGGDICEDAVSGLIKVQELEWSSNTRILFWIADYPCHGEQFNNGLMDNYAKEPPKQRPAYSEKELLEKLKFLNIRNFFFLKITDHTDKMVGLFKGMYDSQGFELKQEPITGNKEGFVAQVVGSVMYSINFHAALH